MSQQEQQQQQKPSLSIVDEGTTTTPSTALMMTPEKRNVPSNSVSDIPHDEDRTTDSSSNSNNNNMELKSTKPNLPANGQQQQQPPPTSMVGSMMEKTREKVVVFNANTPEGKSMVRALAKSGCEVLALVKVYTSKNTEALLQIPHVIVKVVNEQDPTDLIDKCAGVHRAFLCTTYWECFDSPAEEDQASMIVNACAHNNIHHLVFSSFENTKTLKEKNLKSQIKPDQHGIIWPQFKGMKAVKRSARKQHVMLTHMLTSYIDQQRSKKSLCLIVGENGTLIVQPHLRD
jgi:hypothetical protein